MQVSTLMNHVEQFTIVIEDGQLVMRWGTFKWNAPIAGGVGRDLQ